VHYALSNGANPAIVDCILKHRPNSARGFDKRGWTPLHVACGVGANMSVIQSIVDCYPEAVLMRTNKGSTAKQCLSLTNAPNKADVKRLLQTAYTKVEQRYRPAQEIKSERVLV
jgi:ankyrin repeat protein